MWVDDAEIRDFAAAVWCRRMAAVGVRADSDEVVVAIDTCALSRASIAAAALVDLVGTTSERKVIFLVELRTGAVVCGELSWSSLTPPLLKKIEAGEFDVRNDALSVDATLVRLRSYDVRPRFSVVLASITRLVTSGNRADSNALAPFLEQGAATQIPLRRGREHRTPVNPINPRSAGKKKGIKF